MVERLEPGNQSQNSTPQNPLTGGREFDLRGTPTVPLKRYAREVLGREETDPKLAKFIVEFVEANYWIENKIGDPEKHYLRVVRRATISGSSDQDIKAANQSAATIYADYKDLVGINQDAPLTRRAIAAAQAIKRRPSEEAKARKEARVRRKKELEQRYKNLMSYSDGKLQIANSNQRVNFDEDPVYASSGKTVKERMKKRELSERQYKLAQEKQGVKLEEPEDPYEHVATIFTLAESNNPQSIERLAGFLKSDDALIRQAATDALDQSGWKPKNLTELTFYFIAKNEWNKVMILGDDALPALLESARNQDILIHDEAFKILDELDWQPEKLAPQEQAAYYLLKGEWSRFDQLLNDNEALLSVAWDFLKEGDGVARQNICRILEKKDTPNALQVLSRFKKDENLTVRNIATNASIRLSENPFYLQKVASVLGGVRVPIVRAILSVHPEWEGKSVSKEEVDSFARAIFYLPPVGGKIAQSNTVKYPKKLSPSMSVEEQIKVITEMRQRGKLGEFYIHQLTVQGRLPDEFKYVALSLILNSPYSNDWSKPFFTAPWGAVAPLVHDGGRVETSLNPLWKNVKGRTDFLQRVVVVHRPNLEEMEQLTPEEKNKYPIDILVQAREEQEERDRLILEGKAYQRLALALHAKTDTAPEVIPTDIRNNLSTHWQDFRYKMDMLLGEYGISGAAGVTWFNETPRALDEWPGSRHEAEWPPIKEELTHLEEVSKDYPSLAQQVKQILLQSVDDVDREIGLLPKRT